MPVRLEKNVALARSGVYMYGAEELPSLGLDAVPPVHAKKRVFGVYRPATVLARVADKFVKLPVTLEHPRELVDGSNFKKYAVGYTGDNAEVQVLKDSNEVIIRSSLSLADDSAMRAYYRGTIEVSPGYRAVFDWASGTSPNGESYDIIMKDVTEVNHLALTKRGRGGSAACILDHKGVNMKKSGLFYAIHKMLGGVKDGEQHDFHAVLSSLVKDRQTLTQDEIDKRVDELSGLVADLPISDGRAKLDRFISDMALIKDESDEAALKSQEILVTLFDALDKAAMAEVKDGEEEYKEEEKEKKEKDEADEPKKEAEEEEKGETGQEGLGTKETEQDKKETEVEKNMTLGHTAEGEMGEGLGQHIDDAVFDKKFSEWSNDEKDYAMSRMYEMYKELSGKNKEQPPEKEGASEKEESPAEEDKENENVPEVAEENIEEKKPATKDGGITVSLSKGKTDGFSIDSFFSKVVKGGK